MDLEIPQFMEQEDGTSAYLNAHVLLEATPDREEIMWQFAPLLDKGFEANGLAGPELEAWARSGQPVSTDRAAQAPRRTQIVWGAIVGRSSTTGEPVVTIEALDTTTYRIPGPDRAVASIAEALSLPTGDIRGH